MLKDAMTGHLTRCNGADPRNFRNICTRRIIKAFFGVKNMCNNYIPDRPGPDQSPSPHGLRQEETK